MTNLNLYELYDKSLADINQTYLDELVKSEHEDEDPASPTKRKPLTIIFSVFLMAASLVASGYYLFSNRIIPIPEYLARGSDTRSTEEMKGYIRVQIFDFDDNSTVQEELLAFEDMSDNITGAVPVASSDNNVALAAAAVKDSEELDKKDLSIKRANLYRSKSVEVQAMQDPLEGQPPENADSIKIVAIDKDAKPTYNDYQKTGDDAYQFALKAEADHISLSKQKVVTTAKPQKTEPREERASSYYVLFEELDEKEVSFLNKIVLPSSMSVVKDAGKVTNPVWRVYKVDGEGGVLIDGQKSSFMQEFVTSTDAKEYADYLNDGTLQIVIRSVDKEQDTHNVKICCTDIYTAKKIAQASGIDKKIIKIIGIR